MRLRRVLRRAPTESSTRPVTLVVLALATLSAVITQAATPFTEATVTRLQNKVSYGETEKPEKARPAVEKDVVGASNFLLSDTESRAELKYPDGTIVRIGQNTIFSFQADTRTLALTKGSFIFYVPKGQGSTTIKTPSLTAAITGTVGKVSENTIAIIEGSVKLVPSGQIVRAGQFARRNPDGSITIDFFDKAKALDGALMTFNGPLPPFREMELKGGVDFGAVNTQETLERTVNHPNALKNYFPEVKKDDKSPVDRPKVKVFVPPPRQSSPPPPSRVNPNY